MGFGKKLKKALKKVEKKVSNVAKKALGNIGYDVVKGAGMTAMGMSGFSMARGNNPIKSIGNDISEGALTSIGVQRLKDQAKAQARENEEAARQYATALEAEARNEAMAQKKALIAEQESQKATPVSDSYLGSGGVLGKVVKDEDVKKKKRLGGDK
jgi:hypothetical protein